MFLALVLLIAPSALGAPGVDELADTPTADPGAATNVADPLVADWEPTPEVLAMHRALSGRHFDGDCGRVEALAAEPVDGLKAIVRHAQAPPWAPMRAAACLTRSHADAIQPELEQWVTDPSLVGLGIQTLSMIDQLPEPVAIAVAKKALAEGPERLDAPTRISASTRVAVRTLVAPEQVGP